MPDPVQNTVPAADSTGIIPSIKHAWDFFTSGVKTGKEAPLAPITGTTEEKRNKIETIKNTVTPAAVQQNTRNLSNIRTVGNATSFNPVHTQDTANYMQAYRSADYNAQPTRELQNVALKGYIAKIATSKEFLSLTPENREIVTKALYAKTVKPMLEAQSINPPTYEMWMRGEEQPAPENPKGSKTGEFISSALGSLGDDADLAGNLISKYLSPALKKLPFMPGDKQAATSLATITDYAASYAHEIAAGLHEVDTDYHSNFQPLDGAGGFLANSAGSIIGLLPALAAIEATGGAALGAVGVEETAGVSALKGVGSGTKKILSLTERAGANKLAQLAVRTAVDSTELYGVEKTAGKETAGRDALAQLILGPALHGVFAGLSKIPVGETVSGAGSKLRDLALRMGKAGGAKQVLGGEGMVNAVSDVATKVENAVAEGKLEGVDAQVPESKEGRPITIVGKDDPDFHKLVKNELQARKDAAAVLFPGKEYRKLSPAQRTKLTEHLDMLQKQGGAELAPLAHPVEQTKVNATKITEQVRQNPKLAKLLNTIAGSNNGVEEAAMATTKAQAKKVSTKYGLVENPVAKVGKVLSKGQQGLPNDLRGSKPRYGYGNKLFELSFDDPRDLAAYTMAQVKKNKAYDRFAKFMADQGISENEAKTRGEAVKARIKEMARDGNPEDGPLKVKNTQLMSKEPDAEYHESVSERAGKKDAAGYSEDPHQDYEPVDGEWAEHGVAPKINMLRISGASNAAASARATTQQLLHPSTGSEDFVYLTRKFLPNSGATKSGKIFFENPEHHLLYIATKKGLAKTEAGQKLQAKAFRILLKEFKEKKAVALERAGWLDYHIESLKATPHYDAEGNIFNSTKLGPPSDYTKSMKKLHREVTEEELKAISDEMAQSDPKLAKSYTDMIKRGATAEHNVRTAAQAKKARKINSDLASSIGDF